MEVGGHEISAATSRQRGEEVTICVHPDALLAFPRTAAPGPNQIPAELVRAVQKPKGVRLEFAPGFAVDVAGPADTGIRDWLIEFPPVALKVL